MRTLKSVWLDPADYGVSLLVFSTPSAYAHKQTGKKRRQLGPSWQPNTALILYKEPTEYWGWHTLIHTKTAPELLEDALTDLDLIDPKVQSLLLRGFSPTDWFVAGSNSPLSAWAPYIRLVDISRKLTMFIEPFPLEDDNQISEKSDSQTAKKIGY